MTSRWLVPLFLLAAVAHAQPPERVQLGPSASVGEPAHDAVVLAADAGGPSDGALALAMSGMIAGYLGGPVAFVAGIVLAAPACSSDSFDGGRCAESAVLFAMATVAEGVAAFLQGWWSDAQRAHPHASAELHFDGLSMWGRF